MKRVPISTVLLTKNSAASLPVYFSKADFIDDIVVLDGNSTDETKAILSKYPQCSVHPQPRQFLDEHGFIIDFGEIRNYGYSLAKYKWILCIDSDEEFTDELIHEITKVVTRDVPGVFTIKVSVTSNGKPISTFFPIKQIRLFHKDVVVGCIKKVHERIQPLPNIPIQSLKATIYSEAHTDQIARNKKYIQKELSHMRMLTYKEWFRWILLYNTRSLLVTFVKNTIDFALPIHGKRLPIKQPLYYLHYIVSLTYATFPLVRKRYKA